MYVLIKYHNYILKLQESYWFKRIYICLVDTRHNQFTLFYFLINFLITTTKRSDDNNKLKHLQEYYQPTRQILFFFLIHIKQIEKNKNLYIFQTMNTTVLVLNLRDWDHTLRLDGYAADDYTSEV